MALQVWLPLNGDLHNQGLLNATPTVSGSTTFTTDGKIGSCLTCDGSSYWIISNFSCGQEVSICDWVKTDTKGKMHWVLESAANNKLNLYCSTIYTLNTGDSNNNPFLDDSGNSISILNDNIWHHFAVTFSSTVVKLYIDGVYRGKAKTYRDPTTNNAKLKIAGGYANSHSYDWNGSMNDFRFYNHCLTADEVAEIAKCKVLHYPLNNLSSYLWHKDYYSRTATLTTSNTYIYSVPSRAVYVTPGKQYTFAANVRVNQDNIKFQFDTNCTDENGVYSGNDAAQQVNYNQQITLIKDKWTTVWVTTTVKSDAGKPYYHHGFLFKTTSGEVSTLCEINNIVLYEGDAKIVPPIITGNVVYDISGYRNDGSIIGTLTPDSNTPRYSASTTLPSGANYIRLNNRPADVLPKDAITVNLWINCSTWGNPISCTESGGWNFENSSGIRFPVYIAGYGYKVAKSDVQPSTLLNSWHMLTGTMDKDNIKIYIDGVLKGTTANGSTNGIEYANNYLFIGAEAAGDTITPTSNAFVGSLSDIRIYATALSADDILELYNNNKLN